MSEAIALAAAFAASFAIAEAAAWLVLWVVVILVQTAGTRDRNATAAEPPTAFAPAAKPELPAETPSGLTAGEAFAPVPSANLETAGDHLN